MAAGMPRCGPCQPPKNSSVARHADGEHVHVFRHKEHGELHGAVFGVVAGDEFGFSFRHIKRNAVGLSVRRHQVNKEADESGER